MGTEQQYQVKATPKNGSESYLVYKGQVMDEALADTTVTSCNKQWGNDITFEKIPAQNT